MTNPVATAPDPTTRSTVVPVPVVARSEASATRWRGAAEGAYVKLGTNSARPADVNAINPTNPPPGGPFGVTNANAVPSPFTNTADAGTVTCHEPPVTTTNTCVPPSSNPVPVIVTNVPPVTGPDVGVAPDTVGGGGGRYAYVGTFAACFPGTNATNPATPPPTGPSGIANDIVVPPASIVIADAGISRIHPPPVNTTITSVTSGWNPVPVIVTTVPPPTGPDSGDASVTVGASTACAAAGTAGDDIAATPTTIAPSATAIPIDRVCHRIAPASTGPLKRG
jgi:hypothetical protein